MRVALQDRYGVPRHPIRLNYHYSKLARTIPEDPCLPIQQSMAMPAARRLTGCARPRGCST
ncbi:hypothetical protein BCEP27_50200 [Burkholderia cepacia]